MHCHIQFITTPTVDTPGTGLVLHFDDKRYFFGQAHEGLQRASLQHGSKVLKVRELFLTGTIGWQTAGGLLGTMLTLADAAKASLASQNEQQRLKRDQALRRAKVEEERWLRSVKPGKLGKPRPIQSIPEIVELTQEPLGIHGGPNITHMLATARSFVFRQGTPMDVDEIAGAAERTEPEVDWPPTWQDAHVKVWALPITSLEHDGTATLSSPTRRGRKASSRKRDLAHYMNGQQQEPSDLEGDEIDSVDGAEDRAQKIREHVVHEMFRSAWRFDNLVETALADVKMPAKLFTRDPETKSLRAYDGPVPDGTTPVPNINVLVREPWPGALVAHLPPTTPSSIAMSYIVRNHKQRGRFMAKVAKGLGVPPQMNSQLARGEHVTLNDGTIVTPDQVLEAGKEGGGAAIIDIPSKEFIPALLRRPEWHEAKVMTGVGAFIWILGPGVARDTSLVGFMEEFKDCKHIISSPEHCPNQFMMSSAAVAAVHHHLIDPERYALLQHHNISSESAETIADVLTPVMAQPGLILQLEPTVSIQDQQVQQPVNLIRAIDQISPAVLRLAKRAKDDIKAELAQIPLEDQNLPSPGAEIICLGTGSALPSLHRNVAGTLLRVPGYGSYLFDAGENTLGQLKRIYSSEELVELFRDLKMIWISHLHADHHLGVAAVIKAWYEVVHGQDLVKRRAPSTEDHLLHVDKILDEGRRLFVVGSSGLTRWLYEYSSVEDYGYDQLVPLEVTAPATAFRQTKFEWNCVDVGFSSTKNASIGNAMRRASGIDSFSACRVSHCHGAMAVAVTFPNGFKFSYSGDCRPSNSFAAIGQGSTVLVHEATFDDEMQGDAVAKKHSTISEAVGVGAAMGARRVILTHFSQRYSKIPTIADVQGSKVTLEQAETDDGDESVPMQDPDVLNEATEASSAGVDEGSQPIFGSTLRQALNVSSEEVQLNTVTNLPRRTDLKIAFAFDYMRVKVKDIASLERFVPALRELYKDDEVKLIEERRRSSLADGGPSKDLSNTDNKKEKGGISNRNSKSSGKRQAPTGDEGAESNAAQQKSQNRAAGIGS